MTTQPNGSRHDGKPICGARGHQSGKPCQLPAGWGTAHVGAGNCRKHLGNAPGQVIAARRVLAEDACQQFGIPVERTPEEALIEALWATAGDVAFYQARVAELSRDQMTAGTDSISRRVRLPGGATQVTEETVTARSRPNVWIELLNDARRRYLAVAAECARLDIQQRFLDRTAQMGEVFFEAMALASVRAGLTAEQREALIDGLPAAVATITGEVLEPDD